MQSGDKTSRSFIGRAHKLKKSSNFSTPQLLVFVLVFALIGYLIYRSFAAAPLVASIETEQMSLPAGSSIVNDSNASAGKAVLFANNGSANGSVNFPSSVSSLTVMAEGAQCSGAPSMTIAVDGNNLLTTAVSSSSWSAYTVTPSSPWNSGTHSYAVSFTNDYTKTRGKNRIQCTRDLYVDVSNFYGPTPTPTPAPTVTLSASPNSVTTGQSSTLTWASTNASSCTASGAWNGIQQTSGSASTGAINQNSTYTLSCTGAGGTASASANVTVTGGTTSSSSIYWGAYVEAASTYTYLYGTSGGPWENAPWCDPGYQCGRNKFASNAGKQAPIERWGQGWDTSWNSDGAGLAPLIYSRGNIPAVDWSNNVSYACDADIANGLWDNDKIIPQALGMKAYGHPIFLTWDIEMNGTWYHYSPGKQCTDQKSGVTRTNTAADFVAMWQHMRTVFDQQGATNVSWAWCPNVDVNHVYTPLSSLYPGDAYVDWTGLEGYNWGTKTDIWRSFDQVYSSDYKIVTALAPSKPIFIPEIGSEEQGGNKAAWITDMLSTQLPQNYPQIKAFLWFNWRIPNDCGTNVYCDWEIESSAGSQQAFHDGIAGSYYKTGGSFGNLPFGKVPIP